MSKAEELVEHRVEDEDLARLTDAQRAELDALLGVPSADSVEAIPPARSGWYRRGRMRKADLALWREIAEGGPTPEQEAELYRLGWRKRPDDLAPELVELARRYANYRKPTKEPVTIRLDSDVLAWFREHAPEGKGWQTLINRVLREHVLDELRKELGLHELFLAELRKKQGEPR